MQRFLNAKGFTVVEVFVIFALLGILLAALSGTGGLAIGDGDRVGIVTDFSYTGIRWKTWEGQLILGGQGTVTTNTWYFSVDKNNETLIQDIQNALETQEKVKLSYHRRNLFPRPWLGSTTYFIQKVEGIKKQ